MNFKRLPIIIIILICFAPASALSYAGTEAQREEKRVKKKEAQPEKRTEAKTATQRETQPQREEQQVKKKEAEPGKEKEPGKEHYYSYVIGAKDLLIIDVFEVPEFKLTVRVAEDGSIALPLLGKMKVEGLTRIDLEKKITRLLEKEFLKDPQVTVFIQEHRSKRAFVIGAVMRPGSYELVGKQTLLQVLVYAGGLAREISDRVVIIRRVPGKKSISFAIDLDELMSGVDPGQNILIEPGDIVNVQAGNRTDVFVFGQVTSPGYIKMMKTSHMTLLRAIAKAGGFTPKARRSRVIIKRIINGKEIKIKVNVKKILKGKKKDVILKFNDIIFVPERFL